MADTADDNQRLDRFLAAHLADFSRSRLAALIRDGQVHCEGRTIKEPKHRVKCGDEFRLVLPEPEDPLPLPEDIPLAVAYEDDDVIVIDKPAGLVVHPGAGNWQGTLVNALIHHCGDSLSGIGGVRRPGIVHRLDKDTSGLMVVAKNDAAHQSLSEQFADHGREGNLQRTYVALVWGEVERPAGTIEAPLDRSRANRQKMTVVAGEQGRYAITHYEVMERFADATGKVLATLVACHLETGRTHQIRVHMAHIHHPVMGDETYGTGFKASARNLTPEARTALERLGRQALHAAYLGFDHPSSGEFMEFESDPPADMQALIDALRGEAAGAEPE